MEQQFKQKVTEALNKWLEESPENRTLNGLSEEHDITKLYVSRIKNGIYEIAHSSGKVTEIADEYFFRIAEAIGLLTRSHTGLHWDTYNFRRIQKACRTAQNKKLRVLLDADTGHGKTYSLEYYSIRRDKVTYLKVTRSMTEKNLLEAILKKLGIRDIIRGNREKLNAIKYHLTGDPGHLLIIDECEYLRPTLFHVIKEIADFTEYKCGFVLSGYDIILLIKKLAGKKRNGFPQLQRRFFPNRMILPTRIEPSEKKSICMESGIKETTAINVISQHCHDFDMLSQVIGECMSWQKQNGKLIKGDMIMEMFNQSFDL